MTYDLYGDVQGVQREGGVWVPFATKQFPPVSRPPLPEFEIDSDGDRRSLREHCVPGRDSEMDIAREEKRTRTLKTT